MRSDAQLVNAAHNDDGAAFAELYDRYADRIHAFCYGRLRSDTDAADALRETFLRAHHRLAEIADPARFRPWLFAIARATVVDLARARGRHARRRDWGPVGGPRRPPAPNHHGDQGGDPDGPGSGSRRIAQESAELLWVAASALLPRDQELVELHLREGLEGSDLAEAMEVDPARLHVMVKRMKVRLSGAVGSLLVARVGRQQCSELDALLVDWDGTYSLAIRSSVTRHVEACNTCHTTLDDAVSWSAIAAAMPAPPAPPAVRVAVVAAVSGGPLAVIATAATLPSFGSVGLGPEGAGADGADAAQSAAAGQEPDREGRTTPAIEAESGGARGNAILALALAISVAVGALTWVALRDDDPDGVDTQVAGSEETGAIPRSTDDGSGDGSPGGVTTPDATPSLTRGSPATAGASSTAPDASGSPSEPTPRRGPPGLGSTPTSAPVGPATSWRAGPSTSSPRGATTTLPTTTSTRTNTTTTNTTTTATTTTTTTPPAPPRFSGSTDPIDFAPGVESVSYTFSNIGGLPLSWTASTAGPFGTDTPRGTLLPDSSITIAITLDNGLPRGDHSGRLRFDTDGNEKSDVVIVLSATVKPGTDES